ncbi:MAG: hypothetical protein ACJ73S_15480 [Mycobacteriales bacterium]|jgi:hypothetical protein
MARFRRSQPRPPADQYEVAADRLEEQRQAREVTGDAVADMPPGLDYPKPPRSLRTIPLVFAVLALLFAVSQARHTHSPATKADCTAPRLHLNTTSVNQSRLVGFSVTGPKGEYVVTADTSALTRAGSQLEATPAAGSPPGQVHRLSPVLNLGSCEYSGKLGLANLGNGDHTLQLFQLRGSTGALVGSTKVTITP